MIIVAKKTVVISKQIFENTFGRSTDRKQGAMLLEGIWKTKKINEIVKIIRKIEETAIATI